MSSILPYSSRDFSSEVKNTEPPMEIQSTRGCTPLKSAAYPSCERGA